MEKINIGELLKNCPTGMELDCTICDNVYLDKVTPNMIKCLIKNDVYDTIYFHHDGSYLTAQNAKCVIFPKGKTTWEGFQRPFKDGDIVFYNDTISIFKEWGDETLFRAYACTYSCTYSCMDVLDTNVPLFGKSIRKEIRFATLKEQDKLFEVIRDNGYRWNAEKKTLEKLIEPKFKVGDKISNGRVHGKIRSIDANSYQLENDDIVFFKEQNNFELVSNKFDITTLKPFDKVLVRTKDFTPVWTTAFYDGYNPNIGGGFRPFGVSGGKYFQQCIPYEGNEHLRGTNDECDEYFKNWK